MSGGKTSGDWRPCLSRRPTPTPTMHPAAPEFRRLRGHSDVEGEDRGFGGGRRVAGWHLLGASGYSEKRRRSSKMDGSPYLRTLKNKIIPLDDCCMD